MRQRDTHDPRAEYPLFPRLGSRAAGSPRHQPRRAAEGQAYVNGFFYIHLADLAQELARVTSVAQGVWAEARANERVADFLPASYLTGLASCLMSRRFQRLGDLVADTMVIYAG